MHDLYGVKLLSRLRLIFSHPNEYKVRHGFKDGTDCMCDCGSVTETTKHFLLQCQQYQKIRLELLNSIYNLDFNFLHLITNLYTYYHTNQNYIVSK